MQRASEAEGGYALYLRKDRLVCETRTGTAALNGARASEAETRALRERRTYHATCTLSGNVLRLYINGNLQFSSRDEHRYHEALVHPAMESLPWAQSVLILGGGDGLALREVLRLFDWPYGQLLQFTGLTLYLNEVWPLAALIFLFAYWWRQRSAETAGL